MLPSLRDPGTSILTYHGLHADKEITPVQDRTDVRLVGAESGTIPVVCLSDREANVVLPVQIHVRRVTELCCCIHNVFCQLRMVVELADRKVTALAMIFLFVEILGSMSDVQGVHRLYNLQCKLFVTCWI